ADTLDGGAGAGPGERGGGGDAYFVDNALDRVSDRPASGFDRDAAVSSSTLPGNVEVLTLTGKAAIDATGNAAANTLTGNAAANRLSGGAGDDTLDGGAGNDTLDGGAGDDRFVFARGGGQDVLIDDAASAADTLALGAGVAPADLIVRRNGDDLIVSLRETSDRLTIRGYWHAASTIETIAFADGTRWGPIDVAAAATANTPPVAHTLPSDQVANVGQPFRLDLSTAFADPDAGDVLIPLVTLADGAPLPSWLQFDPVSWTLGGTPGAGDTGALDLRLTASDSGGATLATTLALAVRNPNDTSPALHAPLPDLALRQGEVLSFTVPAESFIDPDPGDRLSLTATRADGQRLPGWLTFDPLTRTLSGTPGFADVGAVDLAITATDTRGRSARDVLTVNVAEVNDAPRVRTLLPDVITFLGNAIEAHVPSDLFVDPEGDAFSTTVTQADGSPLPDWLHFDPASGRLSGVAPAIGVTSLQVRATDVLGASSAEDFDIVAGYVNQPPRLDRPLAALSAREGERVNVALPSDLFVDPDADDTLSYRLQVLDRPLHAKSDFVLSSADGTLSLQQERHGGQFFYGTGLDYWDIGRWTFRLTAEDPLGQSASTDFVLTVEAADVNHLPVVPWSATTPWRVPEATTLGAGRIQWEHARKQQIVHSLADGVVVDLPTFVDVDRDPLTYSVLPSVAEQSANWSYDDGTQTLRYVGVAPAPRTASFVVVADDGRGGRSQTPLGILVNRAPKFAELPEIVLQEGEEVTITLPADVVSDADGDSIELWADHPLTAFDPLTGTRSVWAQFEPLTRQIHLTPGDFAVGSHVMTLKAADDLANDLYEPDANANNWVPIPWQSLRITVVNTYDPPALLTPLADRAVEEGGSVTIPTAPAFLKVDPEQTLTYTATLASGGPLPPWLHLDPTTGVLGGKPQEADVGHFSLRVVASDPVGGSVADTFELVVNPGPGNHTPRLDRPLVDQIYRPGQSFSFPIARDSFSDPDAEALGFSARQENGLALPDWLSFDPATLTFSGVVPAAQRAPLEIRVEASDPHGATVADVFSLGLILDAAPPRLGEPAVDQWVNEDRAFVYELPADEFVADPADPVLDFGATLADGQALPAWLAFDSVQRRFSGTPANDDVGTLEIRVTARNRMGATADDSFLLRVENTSDAPEVRLPLADQIAREDAPFLFTVPAETFADVDAGDRLTWSATRGDGSALPDWLTFDAENARFSGTPTNEDVATLTIAVTAVDQAGASATSRFQLSVDNVNDPPLVAGETLRSQEDVPRSIAAADLLANDHDPDPSDDRLAIVSTSDEHHGSVARVGDALLFTPEANYSGEAGFRYLVSDGKGGVATGEVKLDIAPVNDAPVAGVLLTAQSARSGTPFTYALPANAFTDADPGDVLSYRATLSDGRALPSWLRFDAATQVFSGVPTGSSGDFAIRVLASDSAGETASQSFVLSVSGANRPPLAVGDQATVYEDGLLVATGNVLANDRDDDPGSVLHVADPGVRRGAYGTLSLTASGGYVYALDNGSSAVQSLSANQAALESFSYQASDGQDSAKATLTIAVVGRNDAPSLQQPLADQVWPTDSNVGWQIPTGSFVDPDRRDALRYTAQLSNGSSLPSWLTFDTATATFGGHIPATATGSLDIRVTASDGRSAQSFAADEFQVTFVTPHRESGAIALATGSTQLAPTTGGGDGGSALTADQPLKRSDTRNDDTSTQSSADDDWLRQWPSGTDKPQYRPLDPRLAERWRHPDDADPPQSSRDDDFFRRWVAMDATLASRLAESDRLPEWLHPGQGADPRAGFWGSARDENPYLRSGGVDPVSLLAGSSADLKTFRGLPDGITPLR
ncbi:MAG: tandem-95 repeat protein, partial [Elusimicrobia bacterium]